MPYAWREADKCSTGKKRDRRWPAKFALIMLALILLLFGMTFATFYAFRSASTDWACSLKELPHRTYHLLRKLMPITKLDLMYKVGCWFYAFRTPFWFKEVLKILMCLMGVRYTMWK